MSGIAGFWNLDGRPAEAETLRRMSDSIRHRGPDGAGYWIDGPVAMAHRLLRTTPESVGETQPLLNETGDLCLTLDGRVDNREDLLSALKARGSPTDAELVLRSYECWGEQCAERIIGDFAFVIWDRRKRRLFCARDVLGIKPFYYYLDDRIFIWGSEPRQFFEHPSVASEPNEGMIGEYLANSITSKEETLYRGIRRLPPAHYLLLQQHSSRQQRYWEPDVSREVRYRTDDEYAEQFREIFTGAVQCRLRTCGPVGIELSGGLDSSSVASVAHRLRAEGSVETALATFSLAFPGVVCDETRYIQDVVRMWRMDANLADPTQSIMSPGEDVCRYRDFPEYPNGAMMNPLSVLAQKKGIRVMLTGQGGDHFLTGSFFHYADLLRQFRLLSLIRQYRLDSRLPEITFPRLPILRLGFWPLVPERVKVLWRRTRGTRDTLPTWIEPAFAHRIGLRERLQAQPAGPRFPSLVQATLYGAATDPWQVHGYEVMDRSASWFGIEPRHPFFDRRLFEWVLALPEEQRWRERPKHVLRNAMRGILPESVRLRLTKAEFSHMFAKAFQDQGGEIAFQRLAIESMGWIKGEVVRRMAREHLQAAAQGQQDNLPHIFPLWMIFGIDLWAKSVLLNQVPPAVRQSQVT